MSAAVAQLDQFLREADPITARTVEQIVLNVLSLHPATTSEEASPAHARYHLPSRRLGAHAGLDLTKLAHVDDDL